jgi:hypothetical protein
VTNAVISGAYSLSSNRCSSSFGGTGWIIDPDGKVLALTSSQHPFVTKEIDLELSKKAKLTYPRYIKDED